MFAVVVAVCLACAGGDPAEDIVFVEPIRYTVKQGDDIAKVARIHHVDVAEVIDWNVLTDDALVPGQVLFVWPHAERPPAGSVPPAPVAVAAPPPKPAPFSPLRALLGAPAPAPVPVPAPPPPAPVVVVTPTRTVRGAGLLAADTEGGEVDLAAASSNLQRHDSSIGENTVGDNDALAGGGEAETLTVEQRRIQPTGPQIPNTPVTPPRLTKPSPKRCLSGAVTEVDENGVTREAGLSTSQITAGMAAISRYTPKCFPSGTSGSYSMVVEVTVGCDGRVSNVFTISPGVVPGNVTSCVEQTLAYASFAAHGVPDGTSFQYPMKFKF